MIIVREPSRSSTGAGEDGKERAEGANIAAALEAAQRDHGGLGSVHAWNGSVTAAEGEKRLELRMLISDWFHSSSRELIDGIFHVPSEMVRMHSLGPAILYLLTVFPCPEFSDPCECDAESHIFLFINLCPSAVYPCMARQ